MSSKIRSRVVSRAMHRIDAKLGVSRHSLRQSVPLAWHNSTIKRSQCKEYSTCQAIARPVELLWAVLFGGCLVVVTKQVVHSKPGDGWSAGESGMRPMEVVKVEPAGQRRGAVLGAGEGPGIGAFAHDSLNEALGLAVGARRVGLGAQVAQAGGDTGVAEGMAAVGAAVVGHDALDGDAVAGEPGERPAEEGGGAGLALVGQDLGIGQARGIVDRDVQGLPANAVMAVDRAGTGDR